MCTLCPTTSQAVTKPRPTIFLTESPLKDYGISRNKKENTIYGTMFEKGPKHLNLVTNIRRWDGFFPSGRVWPARTRDISSNQQR